MNRLDQQTSARVAGDNRRAGIATLEEAFAAVGKEEVFRFWRYVIVGSGEGEYVESLKRLVTNHALDDRISFLGWLDGREKSDVLRSASLFALPSLQENFGIWGGKVAAPDA